MHGDSVVYKCAADFPCPKPIQREKEQSLELVKSGLVDMLKG
jgi:hypothetical protein